MGRVYGLIDLRDGGRVRYVGKTTTAISRRLSIHMSQARRGQATQVAQWIRECGEANVGAIELEECGTRKDLAVREEAWIHLLGTLVDKGGCNVYIGQRRVVLKNQKLRVLPSFDTAATRHAVDRCKSTSRQS